MVTSNSTTGERKQNEANYYGAKQILKGIARFILSELCYIVVASHMRLA